MSLVRHVSRPDNRRRLIIILSAGSRLSLLLLLPLKPARSLMSSSRTMIGTGNLRSFLATTLLKYQQIFSRKVFKQALKDVHHLSNPTKNLMIHDDDMRSQLEKRQMQSLLISRRLSHNPDTEVEYNPAWSTLIGRGMSRLGSHWSRAS